ncbi:MAG: hypothetical protein E7577_05025 [Ruminococcaceae bacterium]|nr:hypothetical protein [Oscillospiraceae bacterium]
MKLSKSNDLDVPLKNWILERLAGISLSCRFVILFATACLLGVCIEGNAVPDPSVNNMINSYFSSFHCNSVIEFIENVCLSSSFEFVILLAAIGSALTFFCSALLHFSCIVCGTVYGICIGALTCDNVQEQSAFTLLYIFSVVAFAILYSTSASFILNINKQFISAKRSNKSFSKIFVSPIFKRYLIGCFKIVAAFVLVRILYVGALSILHII